MKLNFTVLLLFILFSLQGQTFTDSNLPIVLITTDTDINTGQPTVIPDEPKVLATMKVIYHSDGTRNYITDQNTAAFLNYNGRIGIEIRGSSSQILPKKGYGLTTLQANNTSNNNVSILGMPSENDWVLNALAFDATLLRDYLSYNLARTMGNYQSRGTYCEVVVNGDYVGIYLFMEKLKQNSDRINILKMTTADIGTPNVTGGYITKCDKTTGDDPIAWSFQTHISNMVDFIHESPKPEDITPQQNTYIYNEFSNLESVMISQNSSIVNGFPSKIDIPTFVDFVLMNELASNVDGYQFSTYFHKDRNGKLRAGPIWDFNLTYGLDVFGNRSLTNVWQFDNGDNVGAKFWRNMFDNPIFKCYLAKRWAEMTGANSPLNIDVINSQIDTTVLLLAEARLRENTRWNTISNYDAKINALKSWLQTRTDWITANIGTTSSCTFPTSPPLVISKIHYNPVLSGSYTSNNLEFIELTNNSDVTINASGFYFKELGITYVFPPYTYITAHNKIYLCSDAATFTQFYGTAPFGVFTRNLSNKSQKLSLADPYGNTVDYVEYTDSAPWPSAADGTGPFLSLIDLNYDNSLASSWTTTSAILSTINTAFYETSTSIFPNPMQSTLFITNNTFAIRNYQLYDILGRLIMSEHSDSKSVEINTSRLARNNYILKINFSNGASIIKKLIKN